MEFAFLEMISADALTYSNKKTLARMKTDTKDKPVGIQLVGCDPQKMGEAAAIVEDLGYEWLDINMGCPVPKVTAPGGGSALLAEPDKCKQIFKNMVSKVKKIPVTVKMRIGFKDPSGDEAVHISKIAEDEGIKAVSVHGRTRVQAYKGTADWHAIGKVKQAVNIPVFGNGDIVKPEDAVEMTRISGCDGVMIGRGALGNPWIYKQIEAALKGEKYSSDPGFDEIKKTALQHFELEIETEGERTGVLKSRRILCWYFKNLPGASDLRNRINRSTTAAEMREVVQSFKPLPIENFKELKKSSEISPEAE